MKQKLRRTTFLDKFFEVVDLKNIGSLAVVVLVVCVVMLIVLGSIFIKKGNSGEQKEYSKQTAGVITPAPTPTVVMPKILVHIKGEVASPGLYELEKGSRVNDAVTAAGGLTKNAYVEGINLAERLADGAELYIPSKSESKKYAPKATTSGVKKNAIVNINTASRAELMTLNGIGEAYADRIITYRNENGGFEKIEDIMKIKGISTGRFEKIKDYICVD
ncbi:MAG: ComE operon protein 1 [Firmicutes bacterium ADurb.Bin193]|nr:MAG: ComE operon protein 1 [Firmicutes bacterium ADurb.Bin193]